MALDEQPSLFFLGFPKTLTGLHGFSAAFFDNDGLTNTNLVQLQFLTETSTGLHPAIELWYLQNTNQLAITKFGGTPSQFCTPGSLPAITK